ncbi:MAG: hypothetical protein ACRD0S_01755 [Acidimicrobiales bacterium]
MAPREVDVLRARLEAIAGAAAALAAQIEDLHVVAYERQARDEVKVAGSAGGGIDTVGDQRARSLWRRLDVELQAIEIGLVGLERAAGNLLCEGPSALQTRGSMVSPGEFARAVLKQRERRESGDYTPHRTEDQPNYPGAK